MVYKMWTANSWILLLALCSHLLPTLNGYRTRLQDSSSSASLYSQSFLQPEGAVNNRTEQDFTTTHRVTDVDALIMDVYKIGTHQHANPREAYSSQSSQQFQAQQWQESQSNKEMVFPDSSNRRYDDGFIFKVQRNPEGKLNVVVNDTIISQPRQEENIGLANRAGSQSSLSASVSQNQGDIIFPDQLNIVPQCAQPGKLFCTEVENYPTEMIGNVLRTELRKFEPLFGDDLVSDNTNPDITQRIDLEPGEETLCSSRASLIYPKAGMTKDNDWQFIINHENYTQGVRVEECM